MAMQIFRGILFFKSQTLQKQTNNVSAASWVLPATLDVGNFSMCFTLFSVCLSVCRLKVKGLFLLIDGSCLCKILLVHHAGKAAKKTKVKELVLKCSADLRVHCQSEFLE